MNFRAITFASIQIGLSLLLGVLVLYVCMRILARLSARRFHIDHLNLAYCILASGMLFAVGYLMESLLQPGIDTIRMMYNKYDNIFSAIGMSTLYLVMYFGIGALVSIASVWSAFKAFAFLTSDINEDEEIQKDNTGIALIIAVVIVVMALFMRDGVDNLASALVPMPEVPRSPF